MFTQFRKYYISLFLLILLVPGWAPLRGAEYTTGDFPGRWRLRYSGGFGYEFLFKENYRAYVVIYLQSHVLVFRGIYAVDKGDVLRINISDMKEQPTGRSYEADAGYTKTSSSVFLFKVQEKRGDSMILKPEKIQIDGRRSDGYFEDRISLKKK